MNMVVDDDYIENMSSFISRSLENMGEDIQAFNKILLLLKNSGIKQGKTAEALEAFSACVNTLYTESNLEELASQIKVYCSTYKEKIDEADRDLY
nr:hypothetical protein [uncultured Blautia sp.]